MRASPLIIITLESILTLAGITFFHINPLEPFLNVCKFHDMCDLDKNTAIGRWLVLDYILHLCCLQPLWIHFRRQLIVKL